MVRLYFYVEGQTEQAFVTRVLAPHLNGPGLLVMGAILAASSRSRGEVRRGGAINYAPMRADLLARLKEHGRPEVRFTTLFDQYGLHDGFPGSADPAGRQPDAARRAAHLEERFAADIGDRRFLPHIQPHEFETVLLTRPADFAFLFDDPQSGIAALTQATTDAGGPERVNDSYHTCPSRRIEAAFPRYDKVTDGPELAACIGLPAIRAACPHFDRWLIKLEGFAAPEPSAGSAGLVSDGSAGL